ncbi:conserved hypothetical protein [Altererythrobacter sp. B11]|uniref:hypothetical protein n=1 Tax=Altererythrobacter sp. B11 TaxID=2060312 RepID=UPI000DC6F22B|nr:hypothetical protein [Altererythrobacter sp. B11]BBC70987.1 conserved hypothetical protein [Altererythrobacter sp. B11]
MNIFFMMIGGAAYWFLVTKVTGAAEPWDAETYWSVWYPVSFILSALGGLLLKRRGWLAGMMLTFAQLPVMWLNTGSGPLWLIGIIMLCALALPVSIVSAVSGWIAARPQPA